MVARTAALVTLVALGASGCGEEPRRAAPSLGAVFTLLADNQIMKVAIPSGRVLAQETLGPAPSQPAVGRYLTLSDDGETVFALVRGARDSVAVIDAASLRLRARHRLARGISFKSMALGPTTGRVYLFGNRSGRAVPELQQFGAREESAVLVVLDGGTGKRLASATLRPAKRLDWWIYRGSVSDDERALFVSYHGTSTTGVDLVELSERGVRLCRRKPAFKGAACLGRVHGNVEQYGRSFLAATGSPSIVALDSSGRRRRSYGTRLAGNHLMEFGVDREARRVYAVGSCGYAGGLSRIELGSGRVDVLHPPQREVCGERVVVHRSVLVVAKTAMPVPTARPGALLFVDARTGRVVRQVETPAEPVDVLVAPPASARG